MIRIPVESWKSDVPFSDGHDIITVTIKCSLTHPVPSDFTFRDFKSVDRNELCQFLGSCDWSEFSTASTVNSYLACLYRNLDKAVSSCVPLKKVQSSGLRQP